MLTRTHGLGQRGIIQLYGMDFKDVNEELDRVSTVGFELNMYFRRPDGEETEQEAIVGDHLRGHPLDRSRS